jgi:hypothetical protein
VSGKAVRAELAELRAEIERLRAAQAAHHCHCGPPAAPAPLTAGVNPYPTTTYPVLGVGGSSSPAVGSGCAGGGSVVSVGYTVSASN